MERLRDTMPAGLRTSLNGHLHSLLYASWAFLYALLLKGPESTPETRSTAESQLHRVIALLESMASYRPAASQALKCLRDSLDGIQATKVPRASKELPEVLSSFTSSAFPAGNDETFLPELEDFISWPASALDAFLFSSAQVPIDQQGWHQQPSQSPWTTSAALMQGQGPWSGFCR